MPGQPRVRLPGLSAATCVEHEAQRRRAGSRRSAVADARGYPDHPARRRAGVVSPQPQPRGVAMPMTASEKEQITRAVDLYVEGVGTGDAAKMREAFHP